jgi:hypothetical protein
VVAVTGMTGMSDVAVPLVLRRRVVGVLVLVVLAVQRQGGSRMLWLAVVVVARHDGRLLPLETILIAAT